MIKKIDHLGVAVKDMDEALKLYKELFGLEPSVTRTLADQGMKAAILAFGGSEIELISPLDPNSALGRFLESRGEGIHHICLEVQDVDKELEGLAKKGVQLIDRVGRGGVAGKVGFIHPRSTKGVLIELSQKGAGHGSAG